MLTQQPHEKISESAQSEKQKNKENDTSVGRIRSNKTSEVHYTHNNYSSMLGGVPVPTARRVLGLRMEGRPPAVEVSCEYTE
jgi:hypothetical protein